MSTHFSGREVTLAVAAGTNPRRQVAAQRAAIVVRVARAACRASHTPLLVTIASAVLSATVADTKHINFYTAHAL